MNDERNNPDIKVAAIRNDIEQTRADMSRTVNQIEERLSPAHLKEQVMEQFHDAKETVVKELQEAKETVKDDLAREFAQAKESVKEEIQDAKSAVREATLGKVEHMAQDVKHMAYDAGETISEAGTSVLDTIRANPIPTALIAVGVGWLLMGRRSAPTYRAPMRSARFEMERGRNYLGTAAHDVEESALNLAHRVQDGASHLGANIARVAHDATGAVGRVAHDATDGMGRVAHDASDMVGRVATDAQMTANRAYRGARTGVIRAEQGFENQLQENPLAVGAVALAIGAAIGLALPHTRQEDAFMGETKERLFTRAEGVAHEAIAKVEEVAGTLTEKIGTNTSSKNGGTQSRSMS